MALVGGEKDVVTDEGANTRIFDSNVGHCHLSEDHTERKYIEHFDIHDSYAITTDTEHCLICDDCSPKSLKDLYEHCHPSLPGSDGSALLGQQLFAVFTLRVLLKYPNENCCQILGLASNPSTWLILCDYCANMVVNAMKVYHKILKLEEELGLFQTEARNKIQDATIKAKQERVIVGNNNLDMDINGAIVNVEMLIRSHFVDKPKSLISQHTEAEAELYVDARQVFQNYDEHDDLIEIEDNGESWLDLPLGTESVNSNADKRDPLYIPNKSDAQMRSPRPGHTRRRRRKDELIPRVDHDLQLDHLSVRQKMLIAFAKSKSATLPVITNSKKVAGAKIRKIAGIKYYCCKLCPKRFKTRKCFRAHTETHVGNKFACDVNVVSSKNEPDRKKIKRHKQKKSTLPCSSNLSKRNRDMKELYQCTQCSKSFFNKLLYLTHEQEHQIKDETEEQCTQATENDTEYVENQFGFEHEGSSENEKPIIEGGSKVEHKYLQTLQYKACSNKSLEVTKSIRDSELAVSKRSTVGSLRTIQEKRCFEDCSLGEQQYTCNQCSYKTDKKFKLILHSRKHKIDSYLENGSYNCPMCTTLGFTNRVRFLEHLRNHSRKETTFPCQICSFPAVTIHSLRKHMIREHKDPLRFHCSECPSKFLHRSAYLEHRQIHAQNLIDSNAKCLLDTQVYVKETETTTSNVERNDPSWSLDEAPSKSEQTESGRKRKGQLLFCNICKRKYTNLCSYHRHQTHHKIYQEFACPKCHFPCAGSTALEKHCKLELCNPVVEFKCTICDFKTDRKYKLTAHVEKHKIMEESHAEIFTTKPPISDQLVNNNIDDESHTDLFTTKPPISDQLVNNNVDDESHTYLFTTKPPISDQLVNNNDDDESDTKLFTTKPPISDLLVNNKDDDDTEKEDSTQTLAAAGESSYRGAATSLPPTKMKQPPVHRAKKLVCDYCPFTTRLKWQIDLHMRKHKIYDESEAPDGKLRCNICDEVFKNGRQLMAHKRDSHPELEINYVKCDLCPNKYSKVKALKDHVAKAHHMKTKFCCEICGYGAMYKGTLEKHMMRHTNDHVYVCEQCGATYRYPAGLTKHVREKHSEHAKNEAIRRCKFCPDGVTLPNKVELQMHLKNSHKDLYIYKCNDCENRYLSVASLQLHKKIHHKNAKGGECKFCNKKVASVIYLYSHYKSCKKKPPGFRFSMPGVVSRKRKTIVTLAE